MDRILSGKKVILIFELNMLDHTSLVLLLSILVAVLTTFFGTLLSCEKTMRCCISLSIFIMAFGIIYSTCGQFY